jgi:hypothetical protein
VNPSTGEDHTEASKDQPTGARIRPSTREGASTADSSPPPAAIPPSAAPGTTRKRVRGKGAGRNPWVPVRRKKGTAAARPVGRKAGTSVLPGIAAPQQSPNGTRSTQARSHSGTCPTSEGPVSSEGNASPSSDPQPQAAEDMSEEEQRAEACWNSALMKVKELAPSSKRDYLRALSTYKVSCCPI